MTKSAVLALSKADVIAKYKEVFGEDAPDLKREEIGKLIVEKLFPAGDGDDNKGGENPPPVNTKTPEAPKAPEAKKPMSDEERFKAKMIPNDEEMIIEKVDEDGEVIDTQKTTKAAWGQMVNKYGWRAKKPAEA